MNNLINYMIEANLALLLFYLLYWLLLRNETNFAFQRLYLVASIVLSLTLPLIRIEYQNVPIPSIGQTFSAYLLPEVVIGQQPGNTPSGISVITLWQVITWLYLSGVLILGISFIFQFIRLFRIIIHSASSVIVQGQYKVITSTESIPSFSFFNYIVVGASYPLTDQDRAHIIRHEITHAKSLHTLDLILIEWVKIFFWFNPAVYFIRKSTLTVHEFQADEKVVKEVSIQTYCSLLARITIQSAGFALVNHFNQSLTLKRITMMKTVKKKMNRWKLAVIVPAAVTLFVIIACQEQVMDDINTVVQNSSASLNIPPDIQAKYEALQKDNPNSKFLVLELNEAGKKKLEEMETRYGLPKSISVFTIGEENYENTGNPSVTGKADQIVIRHTGAEDNRQSFAIIEYNDQVEAIAQQTSDDDVYTIVEENAQPSGGIEEFYKFISGTMRFPEQARIEGVSGRVFVEFVVETDGRLTELKILKGLGHGCDEEALRVLAMSPSWKPATQRGKAVKQKLVLPILFNSQAETTGAAPVNKKMKVNVESIEFIDGTVHVAGVVTDEDGNGLGDTNIVIKDTSRGAVTDQLGKFKIILTDKNQQLVFSHIGYATNIQSF